jgi:hypothetical protein
MERATAFWTAERQRNLHAALEIARASPQGENDVKVLNIRHQVDTIDHAVAAGALVRCGHPDGSTNESGQHFDLTAHNYLCSKWSAADGASLARAGAAPDKLPEELAEDLKSAGAMPAVPEPGDEIKITDKTKSNN